ncbi:hypothetical protein KPL78_26935 [Roseomonas sp. HJA6]|uniref:DUF4169 family protein n=1 Tax=Roseomonas alba TaxID=2846776 RepID=A0ABS7AGY3_9PROT|nr:hypothetical protein [Neoroseomonas alba]MBW6401516.1 hypothetical protein [Neoroseomonas alba]
MARKPNYGQQRADVNRSKQAKKEAKLREREEAVAKRKAGGQDAEPEYEPDTAEDQEPARD